MKNFPTSWQQVRQRFPKLGIAFSIGIGLLVVASLLLTTLFFRSSPLRADVSYPKLQMLQQVTTNAFGDGKTYVPNNWGTHKSRIVRTSTGDLFTTYIDAGPGTDPAADAARYHRGWHLMHEAPGGNWQEIDHGDAGAEPVNILRDPHDGIHVFAWPGAIGKLYDVETTDLGKTFMPPRQIPGAWYGSPPNNYEQGYAGATINSKGDMVVYQTGGNVPGTINYSFYKASTNTWQFKNIQVDPSRFTYNYFFLSDNDALSFVGMRDVLREQLGYPAADPGKFDYIFNRISYFQIGDVNNPVVSQKVIVSIDPLKNNDADVTYLTDAYLDTQGRMHILYHNLYDGSGQHHAIVQNGQVTDTKINFPATPLSPHEMQMRIVQDTTGRFYIIDTGFTPGNQTIKTMYIFLGIDGDTDGTYLAPAVPLDITSNPSCYDADFCLEPTFVEPRSGDPLSDTLDGIYGNNSTITSFRIQLRPDGGTTPTLTQTPTPTLGQTPTPTPTPTSTPSPTPTPTPSPTPTLTPAQIPVHASSVAPTPAPPLPSNPNLASSRYSFEDGGTDGWGADFADSVTNSTDHACSGTHSLKVVVNSPSSETHPIVYTNNWTPGNPPMPVVGQTITISVYVPSGSPAVQANVFVEDTNTNQHDIPYNQVLQQGTWVTLSYTVPADIGGPVIEYGVGFEFLSDSSQSFTAYLDTVRW